MRKLNIVGNRAEDKIKVEKLFKHSKDFIKEVIKISEKELRRVKGSYEKT
jgi:hypothetical protein